MTKESVKNFVKDHKTEIIYGTITAIGVVALAVIGVKTGKDLHAKKDSMLNCDKLFIDLVNTVDEAIYSRILYDGHPLDKEEVCLQLSHLARNLAICADAFDYDLEAVFNRTLSERKEN